MLCPSLQVEPAGDASCREWIVKVQVKVPRQKAYWEEVQRLQEPRPRGRAPATAHASSSNSGSDSGSDSDGRTASVSGSDSDVRAASILTGQ